jgi:hypothetical protein
MSFIDGYLIEINEFPVFEGGNYTAKDYFYHDSNTVKYTNRNLIVPASEVFNHDDLPSEDIMKKLINSNVPIMNRLIDLEKRTETWIFNTKSLEELKND